jgi:protein phosphatase
MLCSDLGYSETLAPPQGRKLVFTGDLSDRGPLNLETILTIRSAVLNGNAYAVLGNHDYALLKWLKGEEIPLKGGIDTTISEIVHHKYTLKIRESLLDFFHMLPFVLKLDNSRLIAVHAGIEENMFNSPISDEQVRFILFGDTIGKREDGKTLRRDWAAQYSAEPFIVYGHTPQDKAVIRGNTINIDTGVYVTGRLTAFRWPEREIVSVQSDKWIWKKS